VKGQGATCSVCYRERILVTGGSVEVETDPVSEMQGYIGNTR